jgi:hypothetical protein
MVAYAWMYKIAPRKCHHLRNITMAMSFWSEDRSVHGFNWNPCSRARIEEVYQKMPFAFPYSNNHFRCYQHDYNTSFTVLTKKLEKASQLRSLTLVLPDDCIY